MQSINKCGLFRKDKFRICCSFDRCDLEKDNEIVSTLFFPRKKIK